MSLEEILDEDDVLQEYKAQNNKLINYLKQPRILKRLFEHVVGTAEVGGSGGRDWEEKVRFKYPYLCSELLSSDNWAIVEAALVDSEELLEPFWDAVLTSRSTGNQPSVPHHMHPLFSQESASASQPPGGFEVKQDQDEGDGRDEQRQGGDEEESESSNAGVLGIEVKNENNDDRRVTSARQDGPGRSVLAGYWAKVNGAFLEKKPREVCLISCTCVHTFSLSLLRTPDARIHSRAPPNR